MGTKTSAVSEGVAGVKVTDMGQVSSALCDIAEGWF